MSIRISMSSWDDSDYYDYVLRVAFTFDDFDIFDHVKEEVDKLKKGDTLVKYWLRFIEGHVEYLDPGNGWTDGETELFKQLAIECRQKM